MRIWRLSLFVWLVLLPAITSAQTPTPDLARAETGDISVPQPNGGQLVVSAESTVAVVDLRGDVEDQALRQIDELKKNESEARTGFFTNQNGIVKRVSKLDFLKFARSIGKGIVSDIKVNPFLPVFVVARFMVNKHFAMQGLMMSDKLPAHPALIGGITVATLSATCMLFSGAFSNWLKADTRAHVLMRKSVQIDMGMLLIFKSVMALAGYPVQHGLIHTVFSSFKEAVSESVGQLPVEVNLALKADELSEKYPRLSRLFTIGRDLGFLAMSGFTNLVIAMKVMGVPHADWLLLAVGIPNWVYFAYKQGFFHEVNNGMKWIKAQITLPLALISVAALQTLKRNVREMAKDKTSGVPKEFLEVADQNDEQLRTIGCQGSVELL